MAILQWAADAVGSVRGVRINDTVAQFASNFYMQLDFRDEADNLRRFSRHFSSGFWSAAPSPFTANPLHRQCSRRLYVQLPYIHVITIHVW